MTTSAAAVSEHNIYVIEANNSAVAVRYLTKSTENFSSFSPFHVVTYVKRGSLKYWNKRERFFANPGDFFFTLKYSDYQVQRTMDSDTQDFEAFTFFIKDFDNDKLPIPKELAQEQVSPNFILAHKNLKNCFQTIQDNFRHKKIFADRELANLTGEMNDILQSTAKMHLDKLLNSRSYNLLSFLYQHVLHNISLEKLAIEYGMSTSSFYRLFVKTIGISPHKWIINQRLYLARCYMLYTRKPISELYLDLGFEDPAHFSKAFKKKFGYNPSKTQYSAKVERIS